jgi:Tripartite tricarboxylate transporter TctB family
MSESDDPAPAAGDAGPVLFGAISARNGAIWITAFLAATGLVFAWQASLLDFGTYQMPGPGFIPLALSVATIALAAIIGLREWREADSGETIELGHRDVLIVFVAMLAVPLLFEPLGAYVTLGLFGAVLLVLVARTSLVIAGISAVVGMAACWYFFQVALGLQLPIGPF